MKKKTIVITGGGTGGHIYPGLAIAQAMLSENPQHEIHFVGAKGGLEEKIVPKTQFPLHLIRMDRLHSSVGRLRQLKTLCLLPYSLLTAVIIYWRLRPDVVLGVGGFASGPFMLISWIFGSEVALWEANAYPGLANRWLSRVVKRSFVVFADAKKYLRNQVITVGMPVRQEFFKASMSAVDNHQGKGETGRRRLQVLVFGGSQGARAINNCVVEMVTTFPEILDIIDLKHQTGSRDYRRIQQEYGELLSRVNVQEYIFAMPQEFSWADLIICRAGASTVAEVMTCAKPAIFIPLPTAADDHQLKNAQVLAAKNEAIVMEQKNLSAEGLKNKLMELRQNAQMLQDMSQQLSEYDFSSSAEKVVTHLLPQEAL